MPEGFVRNELEISKNWDESDKLEPIQKVDGRHLSDYIYVYFN